MFPTGLFGAAGTRAGPGQLGPGAHWSAVVFFSCFFGSLLYTRAIKISLNNILGAPAPLPTPGACRQGGLAGIPVGPSPKLALGADRRRESV